MGQRDPTTTASPFTSQGAGQQEAGWRAEDRLESRHSAHRDTGISSRAPTTMTNIYSANTFFKSSFQEALVLLKLVFSKYFKLQATLQLRWQTSRGLHTLSTYHSGKLTKCIQAGKWLALPEQRLLCHIATQDNYGATWEKGLNYSNFLWIVSQGMGPTSFL